MDIIGYFPTHIKEILKMYLTNNTFLFLEEIRLRANQKIILKFTHKEVIIDYIVKTEDLLETLQKISENSIYTYQNQICNGYITIKGGHRVGITGSVAIENNKVLNINYIFSLNFRISKEIKECSLIVLKDVYDYDRNNIFNTLILGAPGSGKTTLLRDLIRNISNGEKGIQGLNVGVIDERSELSAMYKGIPQNDLGFRTDILENIPKILGIKMMIRSMAPDVIVADEIGGVKDAEVINYAMCSGVKGIFTAHGESIRDLLLNPELEKLINLHIIEKIIVLSSKAKGQISKKYRLDKCKCEYYLY